MKRKNIKSFFCMLLVISLLMSLVACVSNQAATTTGGMIHTTGPKGTEKPTDPSSQPEEPTEPTEPIEPDDGRLSQDELAEKKMAQPTALRSDIVAGIDHSSIVVDGNATFFNSTMSDGTVVRKELPSIPAARSFRWMRWARSTFIMHR